MKDVPDIALTVAEAAERLGVTPRALRLYERKGLVAPQRTDGGWRVYGRAELDRLHLIISLKAMGFPLAKIAELFATNRVDLAGVLAAQEEALAADAERIEQALVLVRMARAQIARGAALSTDDVIKLARDAAETKWRPGPKMARLISKHLSRAQKVQLAERDWTPEMKEASARRWEALAARAEDLLDADPAGPAALDLARAWRAGVAEFTQGDPGLAASVFALYQEGFSGPDAGHGMPFSKAVWEFVTAALTALEEAESDEPIV